MNFVFPTILLLFFVVLPIWGIVDAARRPEAEWASANQNKVVWIVLQVGLGAIGAIAYFMAVRPKLTDSAAESGI